MLVADLALARRLEAAEARGCVAYAAALGRRASLERTAVEPVGSGFAVFAGAGGPLSRAAGLGMRGPVTPPELDRVEEFYRRHGGPAQIDLCPLAHRSLVDLLGARGYRISELNTVLVRRLLPDERFSPAPAGVEALPSGPEEAELWAEVVAAGFSGEEGPTPELLEVARTLFAVEGATGFLATVNGEPAGGGVLTLRDSLASLFGTATLAAHRNRGVQTALLKARLALAASRGADLAVCYTLPGSGSQRNVERLGFAVAYTKLVLARDVAA